jgi:predicted small lipoprotein YifL
MLLRVLLALVVLSLLVGLTACGVKEVPPTATAQQEISSQARAVLDRLNGWESWILDMSECPSRYSISFSDTGEIGGAISTGKEELKQLGYTVRWSCHVMKYEITEDGTAVCDCPPVPEATTTP